MARARPEFRPARRHRRVPVIRTAENFLKVERGAHWLTIGDGELAQGRPTLNLAETKISDIDTITTSAYAPEGSLCGIINNEGVHRAVTASSPNTDYPAAAENAELYHSSDRPGELQGYAGFWYSPDGWHCGRGWHIPSQPDAGAYQRPVCSADGKGSVVIAETLLF